MHSSINGSKVVQVLGMLSYGFDASLSEDSLCTMFTDHYGS